MTVRQLTIEQKDILIGAEFAPNSMFNPVQDANGDWVISEEEVRHCENPNLAWIASLPEISYSPKIYDTPWQI